MPNLESIHRARVLDITAPASPVGAAEFCKFHEIQLTPEGRLSLTADLSTEQYREVLMEKRCYADARRVLAHALSKRRALWWGLLCAWDAYRPIPSEKVSSVLQAVVHFVLQPTEENRRAAAARAAEVEPNSLAACLAMAAFCGAGSLAPPGLPCVAPRPFLTGRLVGVTVYLASVQHEPIRYKDHLRQYLEVGLEVSRGINTWREDGMTDELQPSAGTAGLATSSDAGIDWSSLLNSHGLTGSVAKTP
jgi:hypothetical protein